MTEKEILNELIHILENDRKKARARKEAYKYDNKWKEYKLVNDAISRQCSTTLFDIKQLMNQLK